MLHSAVPERGRDRGTSGYVIALRARTGVALSALHMLRFAAAPRKDHPDDQGEAPAFAGSCVGSGLAAIGAGLVFRIVSAVGATVSVQPVCDRFLPVR